MDISNLRMFSIYLAAFFLSAMHSLEPDHGKTAGAAYPVVSSKNAVTLSLVLALVTAIDKNLQAKTRLAKAEK